MIDDPYELAEYERPEWLAAEQEAHRQREADDRAKLGIALLAILIAGLGALHAIATYGGGQG